MRAATPLLWWRCILGAALRGARLVLHCAARLRCACARRANTSAACTAHWLPRAPRVLPCTRLLGQTINACRRLSGTALCCLLHTHTPCLHPQPHTTLLHYLPHLCCLPDTTAMAWADSSPRRRRRRCLARRTGRAPKWHLRRLDGRLRHSAAQYRSNCGSGDAFCAGRHQRAQLCRTLLSTVYRAARRACLTTPAFSLVFCNSSSAG